MSFLAPLAFLGGLIAIPIILLYMLRLRRREIIISSNFLWQQILQDREANTPWQRLRQNILLILQLIILALLVFTLARPFIIVPTISAGKTVILLDASTSMNATDIDDGITRFEQAKREASAIVDAIGPLDLISIIRVAEIAEPLTPYTGNFQELKSAINSAQPGLAAGDWDTALTLAAAGSAGAGNFNIIIISDGGIPESLGLARNIPEPIYIQVGQSSNNLSITALATRELPGDNPQLFVQVTNYGTDETAMSLVIKYDGIAKEAETETVDARSQKSFVFEIAEAFSAIEAELIVQNAQTADYLIADNRAWAVAQGGGTRTALLVSEPNIFLEQVLDSLPGLQIARADALPGRKYDVYIFNGWLPEQLPDGDMLIINPPDNSELFIRGTESFETANITITNRDDPRMAFVHIQGEMDLKSFHTLSGTDWAVPLISAEGGPLLLAGEHDGRQIAILTFEIRDSNLPLITAWPILMSNLMEWFSPSDLISNIGGLQVGETVEIRPPIEASTIRVTLPDKSTRDFQIESDSLAFADTKNPGLYTLEILNGQTLLNSQPFAVNLFDTGESDITPRNTIQIGGGVVDTSLDEQLGQREFWPIVAALALLMVLIEWYVYHKRLQIPTIMSPTRRRQSA